MLLTTIPRVQIRIDHRVTRRFRTSLPFRPSRCFPCFSVWGWEESYTRNSL